MIEPEPEDASTAFVNEELELQQDENMAAHAETQTEAFDHLCRKTSEHQGPDKDAETQTQAFNYLYRKLANIKHLTGTLKPRQKSLTVSS